MRITLGHRRHASTEILLAYTTTEIDVLHMFCIYSLNRVYIFSHI